MIDLSQIMTIFVKKYIFYLRIAPWVFFDIAGFVECLIGDDYFHATSACSHCHGILPARQ
jgi:hypothetical protein